jgi:hypothetical protein
MKTPKDPESVRPALRQAEAALARHLEEACDDHDRENISEESTDELLQLEEELLAAARAVDEAVRLRRQLGDTTGGSEKQTGTPGTSESAGNPPAEVAPARVREFRTRSGSEWRVWEVRPGAGGRERKLALYPAEYVQGWLAFELLQGERRKRLPGFSAEWSRAPDTDLEHLLEEAIDVPKKKPRTDAAAPPELPAPEPPVGG